MADTTSKFLQVVINGNCIKLFELLKIKNLNDFHLHNNRYLRKSVLHSKRMTSKDVLGMICSISPES